MSTVSISTARRAAAGVGVFHSPFSITMSRSGGLLLSCPSSPIGDNRASRKSMILFIVLLLSAAVRLRALQLVSEPEGLSKLWRNVKDYFYVWPFAYRCGEGR